MKISAKQWNAPSGWEVMPVKFRPLITELYEKNTRLKNKKGEKFTVGKILIKAIPELIVVDNVTFYWGSWKVMEISYSSNSGVQNE